MRNAIVMAWLVLVGIGRADAVVLYDGGTGGLPTDQNWLFLTDPLQGGSATQSPVPGGVRLTSPLSESAGYFNLLLPQMPVLPASGGFAVEFSMAILDEYHATPDRAGFSVIVLNEAAVGVELGFWEDRIWAQADQPLFTHAEEALVSTQRLIDYRLSFTATDYRLEADGALVLQGALRDYSAHSAPVYGTPNLLFFGDDTSSAGGAVELYRIAVTPIPVPEPSLPMLLLVAVAGRRMFHGFLFKQLLQG